MSDKKSGIIYGLPDTEYHADPAISNSGLGRIKRSPAHYRFGVQPSSTEALTFGRAFHSANLTPAEFKKDFAFFGGDRRTTAGKEDWAKLVQKHGENVLKSADLDTLRAMRTSINANASARAMLDAKGDTEVSIFWNCEGVDAKARIDKYIPQGGILVDLKTTRNASPGAFAKSIYAFGYHRQAAFYLYAARVMGLDAHRFLFVAVEKEPPYGVAVYELSPEALNAGLSEALRLIETYRKCVETDTWPSYGDAILTVDLPAWAYDEEFED